MKVKDTVAAISDASLIALVCEGGAEKVIMNILLDNGLLIFTRDQMINDGEIIPRANAEDFQKRYLRVAYEDKLFILRVIDSRGENFPLKLKAPYDNQVEVIKVITAPEIEMLIIASEDKLKEYNKVKSKKTPSDFCKEDLGYKTVKSQAFVRDYYSDSQKLVDSIQKYHHIHRQKPGELSLYDLLKSKHGGYTY